MSTVVAASIPEFLVAVQDYGLIPGGQARYRRLPMKGCAMPGLPQTLRARTEVTQRLRWYFMRRVLRRL